MQQDPRKSVLVGDSLELDEQEAQEAQEEEGEEEKEEEEEEEPPEAQIHRCLERVSDVVVVEDPQLKADRSTYSAEAAHSELPIESGGRLVLEYVCGDQDGGPEAEETEAVAAGPHR